MGIITDRLVRAVLDVGLARLRVVVFNDGGQQLSEDLEEVSQHGRYTLGETPAKSAGEGIATYSIWS